VRLVAGSQGEEGGHVFLEVRGRADGRGERGVDSLVVLNVRSREFLLRGVNLEEFFLALLVAAILRRLLEVGIVKLLRVDLGHVNLFARRDDVTLVDTLDRHAVHPVRTGNEKETGLELLDEHDALTLEVTREEDQNLTRGDGRAKLGRLVLDRALERLLDVIRRVKGRSLRLLTARAKESKREFASSVIQFTRLAPLASRPVEQTRDARVPKKPQKERSPERAKVASRRVPARAAVRNPRRERARWIEWKRMHSIHRFARATPHRRVRRPGPSLCIVRGACDPKTTPASDP